MTIWLNMLAICCFFGSFFHLRRMRHGGRRLARTDNLGVHVSDTEFGSFSGRGVVLESRSCNGCD